MATGTVNITVVDTNAAAVTVEQSNLVLVMGTCSAGTANTITSTANPATITTSLGYGPLAELAGLLCANGAHGLALPVAINAAGVATGTTTPAVTITSTTNASPTVVTATAHGFINGQVVTIAGVTTDTTANGTWVVYEVTTNTFALFGSSAGGVGSGGTAQSTGIVYTSATGGVPTGTWVPTVTMAGTTGCFDDYYVQLNIVQGGTIGTGPISFQVSLDAGRTFGPLIQLGVATSYPIPNTGITVNFASTETVVAGEIFRMATTAPQWSVSGVSAALTAFQASPYALQGVGNMVLTGPVTGAHATSIQGYMNTLANGYIFNRLLTNTVDVATPQAWGGVGGQTDSQWVTALLSDYSSTTAAREDVGAGFYNIQSVYANTAAGLPIYRRPGQWAAAVRQSQIPAQTYAAKVSLGSLPQIVVNPTTDPTDGFVYHDERINPGLDAGKFTSFWTRIGLSGYYLRNANLFSGVGSSLTILPLGLVLDYASSIAYQVGTQEIDADVRLNPNGTLFSTDAAYIQDQFNLAFNTFLVGNNMISSYQVFVDTTNNVQLSGIVNVTISIVPRGYVLQMNITIGFSTTG